MKLPQIFKRHSEEYSIQQLQENLQDVQTLNNTCKQIFDDLFESSRVINKVIKALEENTHDILTEWRRFGLNESEISEARDKRVHKLREYQQMFLNLQNDIKNVALTLNEAALDLKIYYKLVETKSNVAAVVEACGSVAGDLLSADDNIQEKIAEAIQTIDVLQSRLEELRSRHVNLKLTSGNPQVQRSKAFEI